MFLTDPESRRQLRTLLVLGRVSNLPTVWSNCLAGWILGGGGSFLRFLGLCIGATCLYIGGMYLNDAFDADFDRQHRRERPIPSGAISLEQVWFWGLFLLVIGMLFLWALGLATGILSLFLVGSIMLYDAVHKRVAFSPMLMALCRLFLFLAAASATSGEYPGLAVWSALVLALYIVGLSYVARKESVRGALRFWPCYALAAPIFLALIVNAAEYRKGALLFSVVFASWVIRCLSYTYWKPQRNIGRTVSGLLAGIVLVDLLAVNGATLGFVPIFLLFFAGALLAQRFIPAT